MRNVEKTIREYYEKKKIQDRLNYEIDVLKENNLKLNEYLKASEYKAEIVAKRIENNNYKILDKQLRINDVMEEHAYIEFIIETLDDEDKRIIELRYKNNKKYQAMVSSLKMSQSTISRRVNKILGNIKSQIAM